MKKVFAVLLSLTLLTSISGCSSLSSIGSATKSAVTTEVQNLIVNYLTQKLGAGTALSSVLSNSTASTLLSSILGGSSSKTDLLSSLVSSKFSLSKDAVNKAITNSSGTLGSLAEFIGANANSSTLSEILGVKL
ncbi:MAG: hypothetical protein LBN23_06440 [Paludibacter sp.]|jgi:uncharacterized protein YceK|nr:hypothetical protein [Paludibacter sp.]